MYIKSRALSVAYKVLLALTAAFAVLELTGALEGRFDPGMFGYFTVLSNTLAALYFTGAAVYLAANCRSLEKTTWLPLLKGMTMMATTVTMLVVIFILRGGISLDTRMDAAISAAHYFVPVMSILDWLLFDKKEQIARYAPIAWMAPSTLYFIYAMVAPRLGGSLGHGSHYPYPFMDVDAIGIWRVAATGLGLLAGFILLGYIAFAIDRLLARAAGTSQRN